MVYTVDKVDWQSEKSQLQHIRERVLYMSYIFLKVLNLTT